MTAALSCGDMPSLLSRVAQTLVCMSAPQSYHCDPVEMLQTWHEESLYQMAEGRRHKGQCLRHPRYNLCPSV